MYILSNLMHSIGPGFHTGFLAGRVKRLFQGGRSLNHLRCNLGFYVFQIMTFY